MERDSRRGGLGGNVPVRGVCVVWKGIAEGVVWGGNAPVRGVGWKGVVEGVSGGDAPVRGVGWKGVVD